MAGPKIIPKGCQFWPDRQKSLPSTDVVKMYEQGFAGAYQEPEETEKFNELIKSTGGYVNGEDAATASGWSTPGWLRRFAVRRR